MNEIDNIKRLAGITEQSELASFGFQPTDQQAFFQYIGSFKSEGMPEPSGEMFFYIMDQHDKGPVAAYSPNQPGGPFFVKGNR